MITNKQLDTLKSFSLYFFHLLKDGKIKTFEELKNHIQNDVYYYGYMKKISSESKIDTNDFEFKSLSKVVLNYINGSVLSKALLLKRLDKIENKDTFIEDLKKDISYIFEILGSKNNGLDSNNTYYEDYINNQNSVKVKLSVINFDINSYIVFENELGELAIKEFENKIELANFLKDFYEDIKKVNVSLSILKKFLNVKMYLKDSFVLCFNIKKRRNEEIFILYFDTVENLINFSNELFLVFSGLEKINKSNNYFYIDFVSEDNFVKLIEKDYLDGNYQIVNEESFANLKSLRKNMGEKYAKIMEYFI